MVNDAKKHEEEDKDKRELIDLHNQAEQLVYQTEKNIKEFDDKLNDDNKKKLSDAVEQLKKVNSGSSKSDIQSSIDSLNTVWSELATKLYDEKKSTPGDDQNEDEKSKERGKSEIKDEGEIEDADFEVVD